MLCSFILFAENSGNHFKCNHCHHDSGEKWVGGWVWLVVGGWVGVSPPFRDSSFPTHLL